MVAVSIDDIWMDINDEVGEDLRGVVRYEASTFETRLRDDVREQYTAVEECMLVDDTIVKQLGLRDTERKFKTGSLNAFVHVFDDAYILSCPDTLPKKSGFIVLIERDESTTTMDNLEWCIQYLESEVDSLAR